MAGKVCTVKVHSSWCRDDDVPHPRRRAGPAVRSQGAVRRGPADDAVEVLFPSDKLKRLFSSHRSLQRQWGAVGATKIALRLQQLAAADTLEDMRQLPGRCHELTGDRQGQLAIDLHHPFRLVFRPTDNPPPLKGDGGLDWSAVDSVTVDEVVDYH